MNQTTEAQRVMQGECVECGQTLPEESSVRRVFCDDTCRRRNGRALRRRNAGAADTRTCAQCAGPMTGKRADAVYCNKLCTAKAARRREAQATPSASCGHCGATLPAREPGKAGPPRTFCNASCQARAKHARNYTPRPRPARRPAQWKHKPSDRFGDLVLVARLGEAKQSQRIICQCDCGSVGEYNLSNLLSGKTERCADRAQHPHPLSRQAPPEDYDSAHGLVRRQRGSASAHTCRCGKPAEQWAYSHADLSAMRDPEGREKGRPFSANPMHYIAMCRRCHTRFDRARRVALGGHSLPHIAYWTAIRGGTGDAEVR